MAAVETRALVAHAGDAEVLIGPYAGGMRSSRVRHTCRPVAIVAHYRDNHPRGAVLHEYVCARSLRLANVSGYPTAGSPATRICSRTSSSTRCTFNGSRTA